MERPERPGRPERSGRLGRPGRPDNSSAAPDTVRTRQTSAGSWQNIFKEMFQSRRDRKERTIAENRAKQVEEIVRVLESLPLAESPIPDKYKWYREGGKSSNKEDYLGNAAKILAEKLKEPHAFKEDIRELDTILYDLADGLRLAVKEGDVDRAYFCCTALAIMIDKVRSRIADIRKPDIRRKFLQDGLVYGNMALTADGYYAEIWDKKRNMNLLLDVDEGYKTRSRELLDGYESIARADGGRELIEQVRNSGQTIAELKKSTNQNIRKLAGIWEELDFVLFPRRLASACISFSGTEIRLLNEKIESLETSLTDIPTLKADYEAFKEQMNNLLDKTAAQIMKNNEERDQMRAWNKQMDDIEKVLLASDQQVINDTARALDAEMRKSEEYRNVVPLTPEQLAEKRKLASEIKHEKKQENETVIEQEIPQEHLTVDAE